MQPIVHGACYVLKSLDMCSQEHGSRDGGALIRPGGSTGNMFTCDMTRDAPDRYSFYLMCCKAQLCCDGRQMRRTSATAHRASRISASGRVPGERRLVATLHDDTEHIHALRFMPSLYVSAGRSAFPVTHHITNLMASHLKKLQIQPQVIILST